MGRKTIAFLLTIIMVIGFTPLQTYAAEITGDGYSFDSGSGILTITSEIGTTNWKSDTGIARANVKKLVIENTVTAIQTSAFWDCSNLISVTIPDSVISIGNYAFESCSSLVSASFLGSTAPSLGTAVFSTVKSGFRIYYPDGGTGYDSLGYTGYTAPVVGSGYSFDPATGMLTITSNSGTTNWGSTNRIPRNIITSLVIEDDVTSIGESAFADCSSLREADLPDSLTSLEADAFAGAALTEISIPDGVTVIPDSAFYSCQSLCSVRIPDSVTTIEQYAFTFCPLKALSLPSNLTSIGMYAFQGCRSLETLTIPDRVTGIGAYAFRMCTSLREITVPAGVTSIGASAFSSCSSLASATFKRSNAPTLGNNVFLASKSGFTIYYPIGGTGYDSLGFPALETPGSLPPAVPVILSPADGSTVTTNIPTFTGTAEAGSTVTVFLDGFFFAGTATTDVTGSWSRTVASALADGTHTVKATAMNAAGYVSADSNIGTFLVDTLNIDTTFLTHATVGAPYSQSIGCSYLGSGTLAFIADGLPSGLSIDTATGIISGTPAGGTDAGSPYTVDVWVTDGTLTDTKSYSLEVDAAPIAPVYMITASAGSGGSITPSGAVSVAKGGTQTFAIMPNTGYSISSGMVDGTDQGPISSYTFTNVAGGHTISATFSSTGSGSTGPDPTYITRTLTDNSTGIKVSGNGIHKNAVLTVKDMALHPAGDVACDAIRAAQANAQLILGFDIGLTRGFTSEVTVTIPVGREYNGQTVDLLHCVNGRLETLTAMVVDGKADFTVTELSPFAVVRGLVIPDSVVTNPPKTGGRETLTGFTLLGIAALCTFYLTMKRRKA